MTEQQQCVTTVQLSFRCNNLTDEDVLSKSDPFVTLFAVTDGRRTQVGRTEVVANDLNPVFTTVFTVPFFFERTQRFLAVVRDDDGKGSYDELGEAAFQLSHVMGSRGHTAQFKLVGAGSGQGTITVAAREVGNFGRDTITLAFRGANLKKMDFLSDSDPFFRISNIKPNRALELVYESEVIDDTLNPAWNKTPQLSVSKLTGRDTAQRCIRFECFDKDVFGQKQMGYFDFSLNDLLAAQKDETGPFTLKSDKGKTYGDIYLLRCVLTHPPTFVDYLRGGLQMKLNVALDFTGSNGDPRNPSSLHFMSPTTPNQYVNAVVSVGDILVDYDVDKLLPTYGFGAQLPTGKTSHCFNVNFQDQPCVQGVQGILDAYSRCLPCVRLSGPTNFAPVIEHVSAAAARASNTYTVLLIITDGEITDMDDTVDAIVRADALPLSIVIVGVGACDFALMDQLDGDTTRLSSRGRTARRDLVQFVPFRDFARAPREALAAAVLHELPTQVEEWATLNRIPAPRVDVGTTDFQAPLLAGA
jgi:hypothetical protein